MTSNYATKQRAAILSYIEKMGDDYQSASEILEGLSALGEKMGLTTIYRHLKNLENEGLVISNQKLIGLQTLTTSPRISNFTFNVKIVVRL